MRDISRTSLGRRALAGGFASSVRTLIAGGAIGLASTFACAEAASGGPAEVTKTEHAARVTITGRLTDEGVECQALRSDDNTLYTLVGDLAGFKTGDRVTIDATPVEMSTCMQGVTVRIDSIKKAD